MPDYVVEEIGETPYLYAAGESGSSPQEISHEMERCMTRVMSFMEVHGIPAAGPPLAVYHGFDPDRVRFRAGVVASTEALQSADGDVEGDFLPSGRVLTFIHVGPYATLRDDYADMMNYMHREGLQMSSPTWEVYIDDPETVPEASLRTKVHVALE